MKDNLIIYLSSRNNYKMLESEVLKNIRTEGFEMIIVDDGSTEDEISYGKSICEINGLVFLKNKKQGVQWATQTVIDFVEVYRPNCKWIVCFQHDIYPVSKFFFSRLSNIIDKNSLDEVGILGFNILDYGKYTGWAYLKFLLGFRPLGIIGMLHLSEEIREKRWLAPGRQRNLLRNPIWKKPFIIEFPMWAAVGISVENWRKCIAPSSDYQFHLWLPDVAMQFIKRGKVSLVLPDLYCLNNQKLKLKYNIPENSAIAAKSGDSFYFGKYSPFDVWKDRWGWDYENARRSFPVDKYRDTLFFAFHSNNVKNGPLKSFSINE